MGWLVGCGVEISRELVSWTGGVGGVVGANKNACFDFDITVKSFMLDATEEEEEEASWGRWERVDLVQWAAAPYVR